MTTLETRMPEFVRQATDSTRRGGFDLRSERAAMAGMLFNAAVEPRALSLTECADEGAVREALRFASREMLPVAVVNGGHDPWARGFEAGNLVLDVRGLKSIRVNAEAGEVTLGGGVLASELLAAIPAESAVTIGICLSVGVVGLTLGGGYGNLTNRFGLAADSLQRARVILADGSVAIASDRDDADLLWALRGGALASAWSPR